MEALSGEVQRIARRYGLRDVYVFGSRASEVLARMSGQKGEEPAEGSDIDIAVQPVQGRTLSPRDRVQLTLDLEDLLAAPRVDLVVLSEAPALLAVEVVTGELLFTADPGEQAEQELYVLRRAADLAPFMKERVRAILHEGAR